MTIFDEMVAELNPHTSVDKTNAQHEVMQQIALSGLQRGGFFEHAAFYGGTCLRIFHGLRRFSEDMDFTLTEKNLNVHLEDYFPDIIEAFKLTGREVEIRKKEKKSFGKVESAFLKDNTDAYDIAFRTEKSIKVKIELDTDPPLVFETEQKLLLKPFSFMVRCVTLPDLFAGKIHASKALASSGIFLTGQRLKRAEPSVCSVTALNVAQTERFVLVRSVHA